MYYFSFVNAIAPVTPCLLLPVTQQYKILNLNQP